MRSLVPAVLNFWIYYQRVLTWHNYAREIRGKKWAMGPLFLGANISAHLLRNITNIFIPLTGADRNSNQGHSEGQLFTAYFGYFTLHCVILHYIPSHFYIMSHYTIYYHRLYLYCNYITYTVHINTFTNWHVSIDRSVFLCYSALHVKLAVERLYCLANILNDKISWHTRRLCLSQVTTDLALERQLCL